MGDVKCTECGRPAPYVSAQLCKAHYQRLGKHGSTGAKAVRKRSSNGSPLEFARRLAGEEVLPSACVVSPFYLKPDGSSTLRFQGKVWKLHRLIWFLREGSVPSVLLRRCGSWGCVNPGCFDPVD